MSAPFVNNPQEITDTTHISGHHRFRGGHGLDQGHRGSLIKRGQCNDINCPINRGHIFLPAGENDRLLHIQFLGVLH